MTAWVGQYCIYVRDLERAVKFYEALGLLNTQPHRSRHDQGSDRREPRQGRQAPARAEARPETVPIDMGNAFWKLYVATNDIDKMFADAVAAGAEVVIAADADGAVADVGRVREGPRRLSRRAHAAPSVEGRRRPAPTPGSTSTASTSATSSARSRSTSCSASSARAAPTSPRTRKRSSRTPSAAARSSSRSSSTTTRPSTMGTAMWKLYVNTDDCEALHRARGRRRLHVDHGSAAAGALAGDDLVPRRPRRLPGRARRAARRRLTPAPRDLSPRAKAISTGMVRPRIMDGLAHPARRLSVHWR